MEIDKLSFICIKERKMLAVISKGKEKFYTLGGKRESGESDIDALAREVKEEVSADIISESMKYFGTFKAQAHGKSSGTIVKLTCYIGDLKGSPKPSNEIEKIIWVNTADKSIATETGAVVLEELKARNLID
jgi:8-oxo-dGTP diphosphatase